MAFERRRPQADVTQPNIVQVVRRLAAEDGQAFNAARLAIDSWLKAYPGVVALPDKSDGGKTTLSSIFVHAFVTARATRNAIGSSEGDLQTIVNELAVIGQEEARHGTSKEWVVGLMQIRCLAVGNMLSLLDHHVMANQWREVADTYLSTPEEI